MQERSVLADYPLEFQIHVGQQDPESVGKESRYDIEDQKQRVRSQEHVQLTDKRKRRKLKKSIGTQTAQCQDSRTRKINQNCLRRN